MSGVVELGRLFGIGIRVHFSWLFVFFLVTWTLATQYLPGAYPGWTAGAYWAVGAAASVLLFASVLAHELSHSLVARSRGRHVRAITLFFLGGVSEIQEEAANPGEEFWISVAGPLTSFVLAGIFFGVFLATSPAGAQLRAVVEYLAFVNVVIGAFNLLPAFPLDGGRVLRALVWKATGNVDRANAVASTTGSLAGYALIGVGAYFVFAATLITGLWLVFIGWFIQSAASSFGRQRAVARALSGLTVRDAMMENPPVIPPGTTAQTLIDEHITREFRRAYIVALGNTFHGLVTLSDLKRIPPEARASTPVTTIMKRAGEVITSGPEEPLEAALGRMVSGDVSQLVVLENGRAVGLLSRGDVLRVLEIAQGLPG
ncbi:MAG: site-2 protease family protein [Gemmatimonadetes bacterium]|nr:site-2 protease family protein [Gemmatimonadota bacterium]